MPKCIKSKACAWQVKRNATKSLHSVNGICKVTYKIKTHIAAKFFPIFPYDATIHGQRRFKILYYTNNEDRWRRGAEGEGKKERERTFPSTKKINQVIQHFWRHPLKEAGWLVSYNSADFIAPILTLALLQGYFSSSLTVYDIIIVFKLIISILAGFTISKDIETLLLCLLPIFLFLSPHLSKTICFHDGNCLNIYFFFQQQFCLHPFFLLKISLRFLFQWDLVNWKVLNCFPTITNDQGNFT